jgi:hypothetical protein
VATVENQTCIQTIKEQMAGEQMKYTMYQGMGDHEAARCCISKIESLTEKLTAIRAAPSARKARPVAEVDLTGEELSLNKAPTSEEVDLTHVEVDDSSEVEEAEDSEAEKDVEEVYTAAEV